MRRSTFQIEGLATRILHGETRVGEIRAFVVELNEAGYMGVGMSEERGRGCLPLVAQKSIKACSEYAFRRAHR